MRNRLQSFLVALVLSFVAGQALSAPVVFIYVPDQPVQSVSLRGSMNDWGETPFEQLTDGTWRLELDLPPGEHTYKYFINGQWPGSMEEGPLDNDADAYVDDGFGGKNAVRRVSGTATSASEPPPPPKDLEANQVRVHYVRPDQNYANWGLHTWMDVVTETAWESPAKPTGRDEQGVYWDIQVKPDAERIGLIVHQGDTKDPGPDMFLEVARHGKEVWILSGREDLFTTPPDVESLPMFDLKQARAHWVDRETLLWPNATLVESVFTLHHGEDLRVSAEGVEGGESLVLNVSSGPLGALATEFPHLRDYVVLKLSGDPNLDTVLKNQIIVTETREGRVMTATGVQIPGVLDDLYAYRGHLGLIWNQESPQFFLWAPTARSVTVHRYETSQAQEPAESVVLSSERGVWSGNGSAAWKDQFYLYEVEVFVPSTGKVERNFVTDPYSRSLSTNSKKSQVVQLDDRRLKPNGWDELAKPELQGPEDIVIYELHVRDFSAHDMSTPEAYRGTFMAFTTESAGTQHLKRLADAGLTHLHLLPVFDIATINENRSEWPTVDLDMATIAPNTDHAQNILAETRGTDGYNWGYDPFHYGVPEGSYATNPDGSRRIFEFRSMVKSLSELGLRVVMDVVYNHTNSSGQNDQSVLDKIVPGYYHRLNADGRVETSTCCQNTATEHIMMERLMIDDLVHWATNYKVDGFRFDLMGHHMKRNMVKAKEALQALTLEEHGIDGSQIYLYGEGWDFGEVGQGKRGVNATQPNMAGTGIGTFNDRIRDAVRGGNPFGDRREQGFATGLYFEPNGFNSNGPAERQRLENQKHRICFGLAGNLRDYVLELAPGNSVSGSNFEGVGYAVEPQETINYVSAHDNETFYDKIVYAAAPKASLEDRVRMQNLALSIVALGQGIPFFHAGSDMLRSKSLDADSYNSGDWFNRLDFTYEHNNFGVGLPPAEKNADRWSQMESMLGRFELRAGKDAIQACHEHFLELLQIRKSHPLFRLGSAAEIHRQVRFPQTDSPGLIVMSLAMGEAQKNASPNDLRLILVMFNAENKEQTFTHPQLKGQRSYLHPVFASSKDPVVRDASYNSESGAFTIPPRTAVVFYVE